MLQGEVRVYRGQEHTYTRKYVHSMWNITLASFFIRLYLSVWKTLLDTSKRKVVNADGGGRKFNVKMKSRSRKYSVYEYVMCRKQRCS